jgi:hypothetical protein
VSIKSWKAVVTVLAASSLFVVNPALAPADDLGAATAQEARFKNLSDREVRELLRAIPKATRYVEEALEDLEDDPRSDEYEKWFGKWKENRYDRVVSVYERIGDDAEYATYDGSCDKEQYTAQADLERGNYILLCPPFWDIEDTDEMALVLVHEESHFLANGGADDFEYGPEDCEELAEDYPEEAVRNADSYELFAQDVG